MAKKSARILLFEFSEFNPFVKLFGFLCVNVVEYGLG